MSWINNTKKSKPEVDERYKEKGQYSIEVLIYLKNGMLFLGYYDFEEDCWWSEVTRINDDSVLFWCRIPKLPVKNDKDE